ARSRRGPRIDIVPNRKIAEAITVHATTQFNHVRLSASARNEMPVAARLDSANAGRKVADRGKTTRSKYGNVPNDLTKGRLNILASVSRDTSQKNPALNPGLRRI